MNGATDKARTYLVVIDDSPEARVALRFAARRAAKTDGAVEVLAVVQPQDFVQWGGVQAAIEEEQRLRIEASVAAAVGEIVDAAGHPAEHHRPPGRSGGGGARPDRHARATSPRWCWAPRRRAIRGRWSPTSPATTRANCRAR